MSGTQEVTYTLDFEVRRRSGRKSQAAPGPSGSLLPTPDFVALAAG